ncbi:uncharacterized protein LOC118465649 isoform X2 [Anopheles albimanus]|uniref:uncharacterized protein LOC118465649 isoform X2 n=1 Tax=Anopheles albimanus TaxID=7167 RepID=UPI001640DFAF|nr:uncharacterized protein LOC118465649 isoform X2 [Anopheles albimanus]
MMALFNKLLFNKKRSTNSSSQKANPGQFPFNADQVRILVFKECDLRGRKLLFDSSTVEKVPSDCLSSATSAADHHPASVPQVQKCEHCNVVYRIRKQNDVRTEASKEEIKQFQEMVFGSAPIAFRGTSFKVHWLKAPKTLMCSLVFPAPVPNGSKKSSVSTYPGSDGSISVVGSGSGGGGGGGGHGGPVDYNPSVSDLSSIGTGSLHSFTVSSSTATQHDPSLQHRLRPVLPAEFCNFDRFADLRHSSNSGVDSGYGGTDPWFLHSSGPSSYRHPASSSHRSSISSIYSDFDYMRRMSVDNFSMDIPTSPNCVSLGDCQSYGSFHRRVSKNLSTSFENRHTIADHVGNLEELGPMLAASANTTTTTTTANAATASDGCVVTRNRRNSETFELGRRKAFSGGELLSTATNYQAKAPSKKQRLGLAVCIKLNEVMLQDTDTFCSEHMTVFESILCRVRIAVEKAYIRWKLFLQIMLGAWHSTQQWLGDLFTAPRLSNPVWLTLSSSTLTDRNLATVANTFMSDLCSLLSSADTKDTNFFISTMITAVLTHHLGWVGTIAAMTASDDSSPSSKLDLIRREKIRMTEITANHPYSVLWAQLGDLYGAVGYPTKLSKTIVCSSGQLGNTLDKILNVLSYFIRCSEIKRTVYVESFDESNVRTAFITQRTVPATHDDGTNSERSKSLNTLTVVPSTGNGIMASGHPSPKLLRSASSSGGLVRSATRMKNLATLGEGMGEETSTDTALEGTVAASSGAVGGGEGEEVQKALKKNIMNDIPNVLVYRDSRFVRQELRIGNKSMDTGLMMNDREKQYLEARYQIGKAGPLQAVQVAALLQQQRQTPPDELAQDALILEQQQQQHDADDGFDRESVRLSYLITENSIGQSGQPDSGGEPQQRLIWGVDKTKEGIAFEQLKYIHLLQGDFNLWKDSSTDTEAAHGEPKDQEAEGDEVVFVLGDNDRLKNIHRKAGEKDTVKPLGPLMNHCCHQKYNRFDKYRQIAANFLKSRNLPDCHLLERSSKTGTVVEGGDGELLRPSVADPDTGKLEQSGDQCATCRQIPSMFYLQTPTNASEMEFVGETTSYRYLAEQDELVEANERLHAEGQKASSDACSTLSTGNQWPGHEYNIPQIILPPHMATLDENDELKAKHPHSILKLIDIPFPKGMRTATGGHNDENNNPHGVGGAGGGGTGGVSSVCGGNGSLSSSHAGHMMSEMAGTGRESDKTDRGGHGQGGLLRCYRTGFMPSLFSRMTDHYMPDMVLQATTAKPSEWEATLKRDLNVAARFTLFEQHLTENNAIIANLDKREVRLHSSQSLVDGDIVGMSQLVSSMLEAVNAMWSAGISAYQCMAFIESKLREMYLQSETIASIMLATDFCTTGSITSAMDITANDMDLLMSVASVHTPEVTKRYRVLMR